MKINGHIYFLCILTFVNLAQSSDQPNTKMIETHSVTFNQNLQGLDDPSLNTKIIESVTVDSNTDLVFSTAIPSTSSEFDSRNQKKSRQGQQENRNDSQQGQKINGFDFQQGQKSEQQRGQHQHSQQPGGYRLLVDDSVSTTKETLKKDINSKRIDRMLVIGKYKDSDLLSKEIETQKIVPEDNQINSIKLVQPKNDFENRSQRVLSSKILFKNPLIRRN